MIIDEPFSDIMEYLFLKECWNKRLGNEDFINEMNKMNDDDYCSVVRALMKICGNESEASSHFFDYLLAVFTSASTRALNAINEDDHEEVVGCIRLFNVYGDKIFNWLTIGTYESAHFAIVALRIVAQCSDKNVQKETLKRLIKSQIFSILVASARVYDTEEFLKVRNLLDWKAFFNEEDHFSVMQYSNFIDAISKDKLLREFDNFNASEIINLAILSYDPWLLNLDFFLYLQPQLNYSFYINAFTRYLSKPTLYLCYLLTNFIPNFHASSDYFYHERKEFSKETLSNFLHELYDNSNEKISSGISVDQLIDYLTDIPKDVPLNNLVNCVLEHPALATSFIDIVMENLTIETQDKATIILKQIIEMESSFCAFIGYQNIINVFLMKLFEFIEAVDNDEAFNTAWIFTMTFIRVMIRSGKKQAIDHCNFLVKETKGDISLFLRCMLNINWSPEEMNEQRSLELILQEPNHVSRNVGFLKFLFSVDKEAFQAALVAIRDNPVMFLSAIIWGTRSKSELAKELAKEKIPDTLIHKYLFSQMLIVLSGKPNKYIIADSSSDYITLTEVPLPHQNDVDFVLLEHINLLSKVSITSETNVNGIFTYWRAFVKIYGRKAFTKRVISILMWNCDVRFQNELFSSAFFSSALHLITISDRKEENILVYVAAINEFIDSGEKIANGTGFMAFCQVIFLALEDKLSENYLTFTKKLIKILSTTKNQCTQESMFALGFIERSFYIPVLAEIIPDDTYKILIELSDWRSVVRFFITKGQLKINDAKKE